MASVFAKLKGLNKKIEWGIWGRDVGSFCLLFFDALIEKFRKKQDG